jgi:acyl-coenzyme A synthetase/AMP-(fatty) acid ligase
MLEQFLARLASFAEADAVVQDGTTHSYADLVALVATWDAVLDAHDVRAGEVVTLEGPHSANACAGLLALARRGAIVVPLAALPPAKRAEFLEVARVERVIEVADDPVPRRTGVRAEHELYDRLREAGVPGLVLFSSGTTGRSKATVLDLARVVARYPEPKHPRRILGFLNLDHIGGINTVLHTLSQGGAVVTVAERSPDGVFAAVARHRVEILPTTPTFLNMVLIAGAHRTHDVSSLRTVTYGTEPMPQRTLRRLAAELPGVTLKQTYGLSELGILPTRSRGDDTLWVQLGRTAGFDHKVVDGTLRIRSEMAMLGYLNAPAPFDEEGWFDTGDLVDVDGDWVRILGRRSEIINVGGEKVYPSEVENVLLEMPNVAEVAVSGRPSPLIGHVVTARVQLREPEDARELARRVREFCRGRLEPFKIPVAVTVAEGPQHSDRFKKIRVP